DTDIAFLSGCVSKNLNRLINRQPIASIDQQPVLLDIDLRNRPKINPPRPLNIVDHHLLIVEHFRTEQSDSEDQVTAQLWSSDPMCIPRIASSAVRSLPKIRFSISATGSSIRGQLESQTGQAAQVPRII